jgi:hypothetical protein
MKLFSPRPATARRCIVAIELPPALWFVYSYTEPSPNCTSMAPGLNSYCATFESPPIFLYLSTLNVPLPMIQRVVTDSLRIDGDRGNIRYSITDPSGWKFTVGSKKMTPTTLEK